VAEDFVGNTFEAETLFSAGSQTSVVPLERIMNAKTYLPTFEQLQNSSRWENI